MVKGTDNANLEEENNEFEEDLDERPGGSDGQDVRARKEYDRRKQAEQQLEESLVSQNAMEQRLAALEAKPAENVSSEGLEKLSETQIHEEYGAGRMDATTAERELERARKDERTDFKQEIIDSVNQQQETKGEIARANSEVEEFIKIYPDLRKNDSPLFGQVKAEYTRLRRLNSPDNPLTEHLAVRTILGSLERAKESSSRTVDDYDREHRDVSSGSSGGRPSDEMRSSNSALRNVDKQTKAWWDVQGYGKEHQERLAKRYTPPRRLRRDG